MYTLLLGPGKSGKSRLAERLACQTGARLLYVATMIPVGGGEAGDARVERHRAQRAGLGFITVECPADLNSVPAVAGDTVLLEDISNLLANNLFGEGAPRGADAVAADVAALSKRCGQLLVVSLTGVEPDARYDAETNRYVTAMKEINAKLWSAAHTVITVEGGLPSVRKGVIPQGILYKNT